MLIAILLLVFYLGLYYAYGPKRELSRKHSAARARPILLSLAVAALFFFLIDAAIFRAPFYRRILKPESYGGTAVTLINKERERPSSPKPIAFVGDSRVIQAFAPQIAEQQVPGTPFANLGITGALPRVWYYLLREIDPAANRYRAIILPLRYPSTDDWQVYTEQLVDLKIVGPFLRISDFPEFAGAYHRFGNRCLAGATCLLRGFAYRDDVADLIFHPLERRRELQQNATLAQSVRENPPHPEDLSGLRYNLTTRELKIPAPMTPEMRDILQKTVTATPDRGDYARYRSNWINRILDRYAKSETHFVFVQLPRGPLGAPDDPTTNSINEFNRPGKTIILDLKLFQSLEQPQFFYDALHLNTRGRKIFTETLAREIAAQLPP